MAVSAAIALGGASPPGSVDAAIGGLRSTKGQVMLCLTANAAKFPKCQNDPTSRRVKVRAADAGHVRIDGLPSGAYAIAVVHDENMNGRLDTALGIPSEGFGFSRNPPIRFGPPSFAAARFAVDSGERDEGVRVRYLL